MSAFSITNYKAISAVLTAHAGKTHASGNRAGAGTRKGASASSREGAGKGKQVLKEKIILISSEKEGRNNPSHDTAA